MKLQSQLIRNNLGLDLSYQSKILLLGSCFAENIGNRLQGLKFSAKVNPMGISYNPISLFNLMGRSIKEESFNINELEHANERYFSFDLHSTFSTSDQEQLLERVNNQLKDQKAWLENADCIFLSLGTSRVHIHKSKDMLVNNCHKLPASEFEKRLINIEDIVAAWTDLHSMLSRDQKIVFTVSPIRHLKDGFHQNQLSKSILLLAVNQICERFENCHYFPSYELMMDELRDYRFYEKDLVHPSELAIDIIWDYFQQSCLNPRTIKQIEEVSKVLTSYQHKAFDPKSESYQKFLKKLRSEMQNLGEELKLDFKNELVKLGEQIIN